MSIVPSNFDDVSSKGHTAFAQNLFNGIASSYDRWAQILALFQYLRWRKFIVSKMTLQPDDTVLDAATGTAGVALEIARRYGCRVIGLDVTPLMLEAGRKEIEKYNMNGRIQLVQGTAEQMDFPDETFDAVVSAYLLRYVKDPGATIGELSRVLKHGGQLVSLEFGLSPTRWIHALWLAYMRTILPVLTIPAPGGWHETGCFLGPSISSFCKSYPISRLEEIWGEHGFPTVKIKYLLGGVAMAMWGKKT